MKHLPLQILFLFLSLYALAQSPFKIIDDAKMPYGNTFTSWEKKVNFSKIYYVDAAQGNDQNNGSSETPFKSIQKAADIVAPGEKVVIRGGIYRECIVPKRGGISALKPIAYEAEAGTKVIVKGSITLDPKRWDQVKAWQYGDAHEESFSYFDTAQKKAPQILRYHFEGQYFGGYNPFGMTNVQHDREWLQYQKVKMKSHFARRGMVFLNGKPLEQVEKPIELADKSLGAFWVEHNGMILHVRFPDGKKVQDFEVEVTTKEQVFSPEKYGLGFIFVKGITFMQVGNGFPVPQRGMLSSARGHHWILEDCTFDWANATGIDLGTEMWHTKNPDTVGFHIVRRNVFRNIGLCGFAAAYAYQYLVEDNLFDNIGWQDAEHGFEAAAIKFHNARNTLIRRNVIRNVQHASGLWLDFLSNRNVRVTQNVFSDIVTARGAIYIEVSHNYCHVDHNIFHKTRSQYWISGDYGAGGNAFYTDGSDSIHFFNNFIYDVENTGYGAYLNAERQVGGRGGITRYHNIKNNVFLDCRKFAIELPSADNQLSNNVYGKMPNTGYLKIKYPEPSLLLDLTTWQNLYHWDAGSKRIKGLSAQINSEKLTLSLHYQGTEPIAPNVGPFNAFNFEGVSIDPRKLK